jgi:hypothetical protein
MANELRDVEAAQQALEGLLRNRARPPMRLPGGLSGAVDILVGDGGGGVDAIEHDIGANLLQELVECRTVQPLCVEFAQDVLDQLCTRLRLCQELSSGDILPLLADEDIAQRASIWVGLSGKRARSSAHACSASLWRREVSTRRRGASRRRRRQSAEPTNPHPPRTRTVACCSCIGRGRSGTYLAGVGTIVRASSRAAVTIFRSAGMTSSQRRVLSPQSGFTQTASDGRTLRMRRKMLWISSTVGIAGEWTS